MVEFSSILKGNFMSFASRYINEVKTKDYRGNESSNQTLNVFRLVRDVAIVLGLVVLVLFLNPITSVDTGTRGVVTNGGRRSY
jgi:hypothetical protein